MLDAYMSLSKTRPILYNLYDIFEYKIQTFQLFL